jgi:uncharacterized protein
MEADQSAADASDVRPAIPLGKMLVLLTIQALVMTAIGVGLWNWAGRATGDYVTLSLEQAALGLALGLGLIALALAVFKGLPSFGERLVRMQARNYGFLGDKLPLPAIVLVSICAGVGEEALFRGGLQTLLATFLGVPAAIVIASAAFAMVHIARPIITVMLLLIGILFGVIYWQTGSLLAVMIGHTLYDIWALHYLLREFRRLGLTGQGAPSLAKPPAAA